MSAWRTSKGAVERDAFAGFEEACCLPKTHDSHRSRGSSEEKKTPLQFFETSPDETTDVYQVLEVGDFPVDLGATI